MNLDVLETALHAKVVRYQRQPYRFRTSHHLDELDVELDDGRRLNLLLKDLGRANVAGGPQQTRPDFLHSQKREAVAYRLLEQTDLGVPVIYAAGDDWLLVEKVTGRELWQTDEISEWGAAARWAAKLHSRFALWTSFDSELISYDADYFRMWPQRAYSAHPEVGRFLPRYDIVVEVLTSLPRTLVHGEFYPSNILTADERIATVDWEMAGVGPGVLDVAALVTGWDEPHSSEIVAAYGAVSPKDLNAARLHLALQWLGWSDDWTPPPEHARDWLGEAIRAGELLGL
jgi:phosphotransferase family enzyme